MRSLSTAAKASIFARATDEVWLILLKIEHADLATDIQVVNNYEDVVTVADGTYVAYPFTITLPQETDERPPDVTLTIDNVDRQIVEAIRSIDTAPTVTIQVVMASDPDTVEAGPFTMTLEDVQYDAFQVTGRLGFEKILDEPFPADRFMPNTYPALF